MKTLTMTEEYEDFDAKHQIRIEMAHEAYFKKFGYFLSPFMELSEDQQKEDWFLQAIYKAIENNNSEIDIEGHYRKDVDY